MTAKSNQSGGTDRESRDTIGAISVAFALLGISLLLGACQSSISQTQTTEHGGTGAVVVKSDGEESESLEEGKVGDDGKVATIAKPVHPEQTGVELWADNCQRCHNLRDPSIYTDAEWDVAMFHMRTRANLTAVDYRKIRKFILSAN